MSYTKQFAAQQGTWLLVIDSQATGFVQLKDEGPLLVAVASSMPASDSEDALELVEGKILAVSFSGMEETDKVFIRSRHDETNLVVAHSTGTAPA